MLIVLFFFLTILAGFQMAIFHSFDGLGNLKEYVATTARFSIGNMGFSS